MATTTGISVLVITGPVGVGKTTVATAISSHLDEAGIDHALIDLDWLRWCRPAPPEDPFHIALGMRNLASLWHNYRAAGAECLVLVDVVETGAEIADYQAAIPGARVTVVRLHAPLDTILRRLEGRETGASLAWHRQRAPELIAIMEHNRIGDLLVATEALAPEQIAREILQGLDWPRGSEAGQI